MSSHLPRLDDAPATTVRRPLRRHHLVALVTSTGLSAIALGDAVTHGTTGRYSVFADDSGHERLVVLGSVVHGLAYVALAVVLTREQDLFLAGSRLVRVLRTVLQTSFGLFAALMLVATPVMYLVTGRTTLPEDGALGITAGVVATAAFVGMLLGALLLGLTQVRRPTLGTGGRVLLAMGPVLLLTAALGFLATDWAHPGYLEATLNLGVSLVGVGTVATTGRRG